MIGEGRAIQIVAGAEDLGENPVESLPATKLFKSVADRPAPPRSIS
jgi:hypothetical protein